MAVGPRLTLPPGARRAREDYVSDLANSIGVTTNHRRQNRSRRPLARLYRRFRHGLRLRAADPRPPREDTHAWVGGATASNPHVIHPQQHTHSTVHLCTVPDNTTRVLSVRESPRSCARRALGGLSKFLVPAPRLQEGEHRRCLRIVQRHHILGCATKAVRRDATCSKGTRRVSFRSLSRELLSHEEKLL